MQLPSDKTLKRFSFRNRINKFRDYQLYTKGEYKYAVTVYQKIEINKVGIEFTTKKITAYGEFSLLASFFTRIKLKDFLEEAIPVTERSPNTVGIYSKLLAYILMIYAGGNRFSHLLYLGCQTILSNLFGAVRLPLAPTTLSRLFRKMRTMKEVETLSEGIWGYLAGLIPWQQIREDWVTFDSTVIE